MAGESVQQLLMQLTAQTGDTAAEVYARWAGLTLSEGEGLEQVVRRKLVANAKAAQLRETLEATIAAGGGNGPSLESMLLKTGLTGWS